MVKNYCLRQGGRKREKFLKVIICLTSWNTSIRFCSIARLLQFQPSSFIRLFEHQVAPPSILVGSP